MTKPSRVPELRLSDFTSGLPEMRDIFCAHLMSGLQRYGFVILNDHPVPLALLDRAYSLSAQFFAQPEATKRQYVGGTRGYVPFRTERAKNQTAADLKEFWQIGPEHQAADPQSALAPPNIWPAWPPEFREVFLQLFRALQFTGAQILEALTVGLSLPSGYFVPPLSDGNSVLRLLHYPPIPCDARDGMRAAAHEDINLLTLLIAAQGSGLELLDRDGHWLAIEADRSKIIVDSGDMLARLTNDVIPATTHRVVNPAGPNVSRYSMPFFMHPNTDVVLSCLPSCVGNGAKYPDITAGTFLEERLKEIGLIGK